MVATRRIPGPTGVDLARSVIEYGRDPISLLMRMAREYGDVVRFMTQPLSAVLVNRPEYIEQIQVRDHWNFLTVGEITFNRAFHQSTVSSQGELHARQRSMMQPLLGGDHIAKIDRIITSYAGQFSQRLRAGRVFDVEGAMTDVTAAITAEILYGPEVRSCPDEVAAASYAASYLSSRSTNPMTSVAEVAPVLPSNRRFWDSVKIMESAAYKRIAARRASTEPGDDLLSLFVTAHDQHDGRGMPDRQVRDELISIFIIPPAEMAKALSWTWYLLSQNPRVEQAMHAELDRVLGGRLPTTDDAEHLTYTDMVLMEAIRLYPPSWILGRRAVQDYEMDGYTIPAGTIAVLSPYVMHHDTRYYPNPFAFEPERWLPERVAERPAFSYFPFAGGRRGCLGQRIAWSTMLLLTATIAQTWRFQLAADHPVEAEAVFTLRPKHGMNMQAERRIPVNGAVDEVVSTSTQSVVTNAATD